MKKLMNNRKGELTILKLCVGFLLFCLVFVSIFLFTGEQMSANQIHITGLGNATFSSISSTQGDTLNDTQQQMSVITQSQNISTSNPDPFRTTYEKGNQASLNLITFFPKMFGVLNTAMGELGISPVVGYFVIIILSVTFTYLIISYMRTGR